MLYKQWYKCVFMFSVLLIFALSIMASGQSAANSQLKFNTAPQYLIGMNTFDTAYADYNNDGNLDVAAINANSRYSTISIAFGTGDSGFSSPIVFSCPSTFDPATIAAGDLNHDGKIDLVTAAYYQNQIAVFLNTGNGQFSAPVISLTPDPPDPRFPLLGEFYDLAVADFDGDGNNDVVALQDQKGKRLRFFHFSADGLLTVFTTLNQFGQGDSYEGKMAVGDLNRDNHPDIVLAGGGPFDVRDISFVFGQPAGGNLSFSYGFDVRDLAVGISINDLDNDGDNDMAVAFYDPSTPTQHSLQPYVNDGNGSFTPAPRISIDYPFPPNDITTGDFNNDGKQDLAVLIGSNNKNGIMVMVTNGHGNCTYQGETYYAISSASSIISADLNHDNRIDLAAATASYSNYNTVSVLQNDNFQGFKAPLATLWGPNFIDAADFNNDGYKDLVSAWATNSNTFSSVDILTNDRVGGLLPEVPYASPVSLSGMKVGDFNGDGNKDALSIHGYNSHQLAVYLGKGDGTLRAPISKPFNESLLNYIVIGDFNSDGKDDVFVVGETGTGYSMLSNGNGTFSSAPNSPVTIGAISGLKRGDFNGDNKLDLVISKNSNVKLWMGDGTGRFTESSVSIPPLVEVVPGDFNGDGKLDLAGASGEGITGILGDGNGGFSNSFSQLHEGSSISVASIVSADFNLDGFDDIAWIMENTHGNLIILLSGGKTPSWKEPIFYNVGNATRAYTTNTLIATDFDGDGKPDLGYLGYNSRGVIYNTTTINQEGCVYTPSATSANASAVGNDDSFTIQTNAGCLWHAVSQSDWITINNGASWAGSGTVGYTVAANPTSQARIGTITIGGNTFTVSQAAGVKSRKRVRLIF